VINSTGRSVYRRFTSGRKSDAHSGDGWVSLGTGMNRYGKSCQHRISNPGPSSQGLYDYDLSAIYMYIVYSWMISQ
jgi:hypothetical protein